MEFQLTGRIKLLCTAINMAVVSCRESHVDRVLPMYTLCLSVQSSNRR